MSGELRRRVANGGKVVKKAERRLIPTILVEARVRRIMLERLILSFGMHPQLQQWHVAVSSDGSVRVLAVQSIFPKQSRWLSYAFRTTLAPQSHEPQRSRRFVFLGPRCIKGRRSFGVSDGI